MSGQMILTFFALYISKDVDMTNPKNIFVLRVLYSLSTLFQLAAAALVYMNVMKTNDRREISVPATAPATGMTKQTVRDFDLAEVKKYAWSIITNTALMAFFHFKLEASVPLFFQIFFGAFRVWEWEMSRIHLFGETEDDFPALKRPFPVPPNPLQSLMQSFGGPAAEEEPQQQQVQEGDQQQQQQPRRDPPRVEIIDDDDEVKETKKNK